MLSHPGHPRLGSNARSGLVAALAHESRAREMVFYNAITDEARDEAGDGIAAEEEQFELSIGGGEVRGDEARGGRRREVGGRRLIPRQGTRRCVMRMQDRVCPHAARVQCDERCVGVL